MSFLARGNAQVLGVLVAFGMTFGTARAATILISEITGGAEGPITVTVDGASIPVTLLPGATAAATFQFNSSANSGVSGSFSRDLGEPQFPREPEEPGGQGTVSDRLRLDISNVGTNIIDFQFSSDPDVDRVTPGGVVFASVLETGGPQDVLFYVRPSPGSAPIILDSVPPGFQVVDTFQMASDVPIPEPLSLTLLGVGILTVFFYMIAPALLRTGARMSGY